MDFLRLSTTTFEDPKIKVLRSRFGRDGYLIYIHSLYLIAQGLTTKNTKCELPFAADTLAFDLGMEKEQIVKILNTCIELDLIEGDPTNTIICTKVLKRLEKNRLSPGMRKLVDSVEYETVTDVPKELPQNEKEDLKGFSEKVFEIWTNNKLPCKKGGLISFQQADMRKAIMEIRQQKLSVEDVIQACKNYVEVLNDPNSWYTAKLPFENFMKESTIKRFLPDYYKKEYFVNSNGNSGVNKSGSDKCSEVGF